MRWPTEQAALLACSSRMDSAAIARRRRRAAAALFWPVLVVSASLTLAMLYAVSPRPFWIECATTERTLDLPRAVILCGASASLLLQCFAIGALRRREHRLAFALLLGGAVVGSCCFGGERYDDCTRDRTVYSGPWGLYTELIEWRCTL